MGSITLVSTHCHADEGSILPTGTVTPAIHYHADEGSISHMSIITTLRKTQCVKPIGTHNYYLYILTNPNKTVLYIGVSNSVEIRVGQHKADAAGPKKTFAGKYNCTFVIYTERFQYIADAIAREKELKGWTRAKKEALINSVNPTWEFLHEQW